MKHLILALLLSLSAFAAKPIETLTDAEKAAMRSGIDTTNPLRVGFYDNFADPVRWPDGTRMSHKMTTPTPLYGSDVWYWASNDLEAPFVFNGAMRILRRGGGYMAAHASPEDLADFSYFFEFWREPTGQGGSAGGLTLTVGSGNLVQEDGSTHNAPGNFHMNMNETGITQSGLYGSSISISSATDAGNAFTTTVPHNYATGDLLLIGTVAVPVSNAVTNGTTTVTMASTASLVAGMTVTGTGISGGTTVASITNATTIILSVASGSGTVNLTFTSVMPAGVAAGGHYAIVTSATAFRVATTRALANVNSHTELTTDGVGVLGVERAMECVNRPYKSGAHHWAEPANTSLLFQGSTTDTLTFDGPSGFGVGDPVMLGGGGLPTAVGGNLAEKTVYYVLTSSANTVTLSRTPGGAVIDLTSNGSANQTIYGPRYDIGGIQANSMPANRKSCIVVTVKGDYLTFSLVGVGEVIYYWRNLNAIFSGSTTANGKTVGFYYQSTQPEAPGSIFYTNTFPLVSVGIDAPELLRQTLQQYTGYVGTLAQSGRHKLPGQLNLTDARQGHFGTAIHQNLAANEYPLFIGGSGRTSLGGGLYRISGGHAFAEGGYLSQQGFSVASVSQIGIAPANINAGIDATISSVATGAEVTLKNLESVMTLQTGDMETVVITGQLVGAGTKRIRIAHYNNTALSPTIFDSNLAGTPLDAVAKPYEIVIRRKQEGANTHVTSTTMIVDGVTIGPQRTVANMAMNYQYYSTLITQADASAITIDQIDQTIKRVKR